MANIGLHIYLFRVKFCAFGRNARASLPVWMAWENCQSAHCSRRTRSLLVCHVFHSCSLFFSLALRFSFCLFPNVCFSVSVFWYLYFSICRCSTFSLFDSVHFFSSLLTSFRPCSPLSSCRCSLLLRSALLGSTLPTWISLAPVYQLTFLSGRQKKKITLTQLFPLIWKWFKRNPDAGSNLCEHVTLNWSRSLRNKMMWQPNYKVPFRTLFAVWFGFAFWYPDSKLMMSWLWHRMGF